MNKKLDGKKIVVTGAAKGIGKGIAKAFLQNGADVFICSRNETDLRRAAEELSGYGDIHYMRTDISNRKDVIALKEAIEKKWNGLDVLVNNASILGARTKIEDYPEEVWDKVIDININAQFYITKQLIPLLKKGLRSSVINLSSSVGRTGRSLWGAYSVSKFGIEGFTQILSQELSADGIRVNSVNPGGTRTEMRANAYPDEDPATLPAPEDISPVFIYLASDDSKDVTGEQFNARDWIE